MSPPEPADPPTNLEIARTVYRAVNSGDAETFLDYFSDDVLIHEPAGLPYGGTYSGKADLARLLAALAEFWDGLQLAPDDMFDADPCVVIRGRILATVRATGRSVEQPYLELLRFENGKAVEAWVQMDTADLLST